MHRAHWIWRERTRVHLTELSLCFPGSPFLYLERDNGPFPRELL